MILLRLGTLEGATRTERSCAAMLSICVVCVGFFLSTTMSYHVRRKKDNNLMIGVAGIFSVTLMISGAWYMYRSSSGKEAELDTGRKDAVKIEGDS